MNLNNRLQQHNFGIAIFLFITMALGSLGFGLLVQHNLIIKSFDNVFYVAIHDGYHSRIIDLFILPFNYNFLPRALSPGRMPSYYYLMFIFTIGYLAIFKRSLVWWTLFCFVFGTILALIISFLDWHFIFRERPFYALPNSVDEFGRSAWGKLSSYPSGHVRDTTLYSTIIVNFIPKLKRVAIIFVLFIAYSRVYIGAHYPTDVLSGIIIGYIVAFVTLMVARELQLIIQKRKGELHGHKPKPAQKGVR